MAAFSVRHLARGTCWLGLIAGFSLFAGCGRPSGSVHGKVTYKGQALKGGNVMLVSTEGQQSASGGIKEDGTYTIPQVKAGSYKVCVETNSIKPPNAMEKRRMNLPPKGKGGAPEGAIIPEGYTPSNPGEMVAAKNAKLYTPIPDKYSKPDTTDLRLDVKGGDNTYDIDVK